MGICHSSNGRNSNTVAVQDTKTVVATGYNYNLSNRADENEDDDRRQLPIRIPIDRHIELKHPTLGTTNSLDYSFEQEQLRPKRLAGQLRNTTERVSMDQDKNNNHSFDSKENLFSSDSTRSSLSYSANARSPRAHQPARESWSRIGRESDSDIDSDHPTKQMAESDKLKTLSEMDEFLSRHVSVETTQEALKMIRDSLQFSETVHYTFFIMGASVRLSSI